MTPSNRFIDFLRENPEIWAALQAEWERRGVEVGDSCIGTILERLAVLGTVHKHLTKDTEGGRLTGWAVSEAHSGRLHWYCNKDKRIWENWRWLPSLGQLLEMVEEAAKDTKHDEIVLTKWYGEWTASLAATHCGETDYPYGSEGEKEPEIAAASLWWRLRGEG